MKEEKMLHRCPCCISMSMLHVHLLSPSRFRNKDSRNLKFSV
jgi:hypothetical protein